MVNGNVIVDKSMEFAVRTVKLYKYLSSSKEENVMSKQLLRSGTSIGANVKEAVYGQSKKDFIAKMSIGLKEAVESEYWLELLFRTEYLMQEEFESMQSDCSEIAKMLTRIIKTAKESNVN